MIEIDLDKISKNELATILIQKDKEIERLNNKVEELMTLYTTERNVKEDYKTIIKEVREYVDKWEDISRYKLLEILKGSDK